MDSMRPRRWQIEPGDRAHVLLGRDDLDDMTGSSSSGLRLQEQLRKQTRAAS
jgi:hypothetical protein